MTQEELDAIMNGDIDLEEGYEEEDFPYPQEFRTASLPEGKTPETAQDGDALQEKEGDASNLSDMIRELGDDLAEGEKQLEAVGGLLRGNIDLFQTLCRKFPHIEAFQIQLSKNQEASHTLAAALGILQNGSDTVMNVTDIMQYQQLHYQRMEEGIGALHALLAYLKRLPHSHLPDETAPKRSAEEASIETFLASFSRS